MNDIFIYNAGPLFTEADQVQRLQEQQQFDSLQGVFVFNPLTAPGNEGALSAKKIFEVDNEAIQQATVFFFDLANKDTGTLVELGMVIQMLEDGKKLSVYPVISDFRAYDRDDYQSMFAPLGYNSFIIGSLEAHNIPIFKSFNDAFAAFVADYNR